MLWQYDTGIMMRQYLQVQSINFPVAETAGVTLYMARADQLHPLASGNKIYKLSLILDNARKNKIKKLLSFGGAYSNHLHALALMANEFNMQSIGIIRGEKEYANNPTLQDVQHAGMQLEFVSRDIYKRRGDTDYLEELQERFPDALIIPEGGSSQEAISGCAQLGKDINKLINTDIVTLACGTGATLAGVVCGLKETQTAIGYSALKDQTLNKRVQDFIKSESGIADSYKIEQADYGGFAKLNKELLDFVFDWLDTTKVLLDPVYTSKMCMRLIQQIEAGEFSAGTTITMIHSGGLQGWRGMKPRVIKLAGEDGWHKINGYLKKSGYYEKLN